MTLQHHKKLVNTKYFKRILTFMFPVQYSPNEPVYFIGFFTSWIRNTDYIILYIPILYLLYSVYTSKGKHSFIYSMAPAIGNGEHIT